MTAKFKGAVGLAGAALAWSAITRTSRHARYQRTAGQVVLITGGSRGFGFALAQAFASLKCRLALCARNQAELQRAKETLSSTGCDVSTYVCDVSDRHSVDAMVEEIINRYGQIDVLVNNAGEIVVAPLEDLTTADFERAMATIFWGTVNCTLAVLPSMKERGYGRIVNVTSIGGKVSVPHLLSYSCAKAAAIAFSNGLRTEAHQFGVRVTTIIPGLMRTGSHVNALFKGNKPAEASWFGVAASFPLISISTEHAVRLTMDAICSGKAEKVLGFPAQALVTMQAHMPELTGEILRIGNSLLPSAKGDDASIQDGMDLDATHGSLYRLLTTLGRTAGQRLNQTI